MDEKEFRSAQIVESAVLVCRAPHPKALEGDTRFQGRLHGIRLQIVPFQARPTYRQVDDWADVRPGCVVVRCSSCGAFTEYAVVGEVKRSEQEDEIPESSTLDPKQAMGGDAATHDGRPSVRYGRGFGDGMQDRASSTALRAIQPPPPHLDPGAVAS